MSHPVVVLDRDGTINEEMGYINHLSRFRLLPQAIPAIRRLNVAGVKAVLVTNQSGAGVATNLPKISPKLSLGIMAPVAGSVVIRSG